MTNPSQQYTAYIPLHVYLAIPYRGTKEQVEERMVIFKKAVAHARRCGHFVTSPVFHHWTFDDKPADDGSDSYWLDYSEALLVAMASAIGAERQPQLWIITLPGWKQSSGIKHEIEVAKRLGMQIAPIEVNDDGQIFLDIDELDYLED